jgi:Zn-dependent protease
MAPHLFNLLPVSPLDGGRIVAAISRWLWIVGLVGLVGLFVLHPNPFVLLIALIGGAETMPGLSTRPGTPLLLRHGCGSTWGSG